MVVASGGGLLAHTLKNKRVAFTRPMPSDPNTPIGGYAGCYAEYIVTDAKLTIAISNQEIDFDHASCFFVNPATAIGLLETLAKAKARYVIQTGAASQLARMMFRLAPSYNVTFINIVRREEQVTMLKEEFHQDYVINSSSDSFKTELKALVADLDIKTCLECVAGDMTGRILDCMGNNSTIILYGALSESPVCRLDPRKFIYGGCRL